MSAEAKREPNPEDGGPRSDAGPRMTIPSSDEGLVRALGVRALAANAINLTVGSGIFVLPAAVAAAMGAAGLLAYVVCGLAMCLVLLCYAEAGSRVARSGGSYAYVEAAFGPFVGFLVGTLLWFAYGALSSAAIAKALVTLFAPPKYISTFTFSDDRLQHAVPLILLFAILVFINIRGVRQGARFAIGVTIAKLLPLVVLIAVGLPAVQAENLRWAAWPSLESLGETALLLFFAFGGPESALTASGEVRDPPRTVPLAILIASGSVLTLYLALHVVAQGVLGSDLAAGTQAPLADAAERILGAPGWAIVFLGSALAMFGALAGDLLATPRALFAAGRDGFLPAALAKVHPRFRTPHVAIIAYAALACAFAATGTFQQLAVLASASILLIYLAVCLATLALSRRGVRLERPPFRLPAAPVIPVLACAVIVWLLAHSARREVVAIAAFLVAASLVFLARRRRATTAMASTGIIDTRSAKKGAGKNA